MTFVNSKQDRLPLIHDSIMLIERSLSKLACLLFTQELDTRLKAANKTTISVAAHLGVSTTDWEAQTFFHEGIVPDFDESAFVKVFTMSFTMSFTKGYGRR